MEEAVKEVRKRVEELHPRQAPVTPRDELEEAVIAWANQGSRSKWSTEESLRLWDLAQQLKARDTETEEQLAGRLRAEYGFA